MKIILSAKASQQLIDLFQYLKTTFSVATRKKFQKRLEKYIAAIKLLPEGFPESGIYPGCRKCVVSKQTSLIYRVREDIIEILAILDNRKAR